jgi:hypothetical protein
MDELSGWDPPPPARGVEVALLPMGICELDAGRVLLSHIEEMDCLSYDDLAELEGLLGASGVELSFADEGLQVDV